MKGLLAILLGVFSVLTCRAENPLPLSQQELLAGSETDYPPFCLVQEDGYADGFSVELLRASLQVMGRSVRFRTGPWAQVQQWLKDGEVEVLPLVGRTPEREPFFDFTVPYLTMYGAIVVRQESTEIRQLQDLRGRRIGVMRGDNAEEFLRREDLDLELVLTPTFVDAFRLLADGGCEAVVIQRLVALRLLQDANLEGLRILPQPVEEFSQDFCFAVRKGEGATLAMLNEGLALVIAEGTYRRLFARWFAASMLPGQVITVGGDYAFPPFEYLDNNGRPAGLAVDMTRAVAKAMSLDVQIRLMDWDHAVQGLRNGDVDVLQGMYYHPRRAREFDFSPPYHTAHYVTVVRRGEGHPPRTVDELIDRKILVQRSDLLHEYLVASGADDDMLLLRGSQEEVLRSLHEGEGDCAVVARMSALAMIQEYGWKDLVVSAKPFHVAEYCFAVLKGNQAVLVQFSEGLKVLEASGEHRKILDRWVGVPEPERRAMVVLKYTGAVLLTLLLVLFVVLGWSRSLQHQVRERTQALEQRLEDERLLAAVSALAVRESDLDRLLAQGLEQIGQSTSVSRAYLFEQTGAGMMSNTFEWCAAGISAQKDRLQNIQMKDSDWWFSTLRRGETICCEHLEEIPDPNVRALLREQQIVALVVVPLFVQDRFYGFLGLDQCFAPRAWPDMHVAMLKAIAGILCNAIEGRRFARALDESEGRYQRLVECSQAIIFTFTEAGTLLFASPMWKQILGHDPQQVAGTRFAEYVLEEDRPLLQNYLREQSRREGARSGIDLRALHKEGALVWLRMVVTPMHEEDGRLVSMVGNAVDITERMNMEQEQARLEFQLQQAQRMESIGRLAGGVAHDFNNLLQVILGNAETALQSKMEVEAVKDCLQEIRKAGLRAVDVARQLLAFARQQVRTPVILNVTESVENMLKMLRRLVGEDVRLSFQSGNPELRVKMDSGQLDQILVNLCVNARDALDDEDGQIEIHVCRKSLAPAEGRWHGVDAGEYVCITVRDNGCGIDRETVDHMFELFYTTKEAGRGTGMGLATVYGIVHQNAGWIQVDSTPGQGTVFTVCLPAYDGKEQEHTDQSEAPVVAGAASGVVLLVEDEPSILKTVKVLLQRQGYTVMAASQPADALRIAREFAGKIDLLMTDVIMPELNGKELSERILKLHPETKRLFMSGYTADVLDPKGVLDPDLHFIQKPFSRQALVAKLQEVLQGSQ